MFLGIVQTIAAFRSRESIKIVSYILMFLRWVFTSLCGKILHLSLRNLLIGMDKSHPNRIVYWYYYSSFLPMPPDLWVTLSSIRKRTRGIYPTSSTCDCSKHYRKHGQNNSSDPHRLSIDFHFSEQRNTQ